MSVSSPSFGFDGTPDQGLFPISVVTELTGIGPHVLRGYERAGLVRPARTDGGIRRYSSNDLALVRRAAALSGEGINLAGIRRILVLEAELAALRAEIEALRRS
jgi:MerR family transcriptional regulator/heat shock protein HspR